MSRLRAERHGWDVLDVRKQHNPNRWHPVHLRKPLHRLIAGIEAGPRQLDAVASAAREGLRLLLGGGELA